MEQLHSGEAEFRLNRLHSYDKNDNHNIFVKS